ncbi:hypothetical protein LWC33_34410 [Pseudonocardia sp. RS11V-5]|uniref:hypothetical protein n=1 Tax=Pseudonocardia terrae TaxID=2905831 RepID=UPI001E52699D|nr:hypothetical protein [Pseudonocardia terrae]MCE3556519.1 hypothetical protein [Pseudonocardia terrae]
MTLTALPPSTGSRPAVGYTPAPFDRTRVDDVSSAVARLAREFAGQMSHRVVARVVRECRADLSGVPAGAVPELLERLARQRLLDRLDRRAAANPLPPCAS